MFLSHALPMLHCFISWKPDLFQVKLLPCTVGAPCKKCENFTSNLKTITDRYRFSNVLVSIHYKNLDNLSVKLHVNVQQTRKNYITNVFVVFILGKQNKWNSVFTISRFPASFQQNRPNKVAVSFKLQL